MSLADLAGSDSAGPPGDLVGGPADLASRPGEPKPPPGAVKCGDGTLTNADSRLACMAPSSLLDAWGMQRQPFPRACDAATIATGSWQVWCTQTEAYVHVRLNGLRATGSLMCKNTTLLALGAVYESGNGGGDTGNNDRSGYAGVPSYQFDVAPPIDASLWITVGVAAKSATLWLAPYSALIPGCGAMNSGYRTIVAGAKVTWKP